MRVLAHVHTFNDADIIDRTIDGLLRQTRLPDAIVLVDNGSTDGTLDRAFSELVAIIRNPTNLGTSGAVRNGFIHALKHQFDWIWLFDADSVPEPDALQRLLDLYASFPEEMRERIGFLSCLPCDQRDGQPRHGGLFTRLGLAVARPAPERCYYPCHATIWSGCLYRLAAVRRIGLPNPNYVLDRGEDEYGYRVMKAGYKAFIHQGAVLRHNVRGTTSLTEVNCTLGPVAIKFYEFPSIRCYYTCRNTLYFALYEAAEGRFGLLRGALWRMRPSPERPGFMRGAAWRVLLLTLNFLLRPSGHGAQILACLRGIWHGVTGNIRARY